MGAAELRRFTWIEGDADSSAGIKVEAQTGKSLFIQAAQFDCISLAEFVTRLFPGAVSTDLVRQVQTSRESNR